MTRRVLALTAGRIVTEHLGRPLDGFPAVAVLAHWSDRPAVSLSARRLVEELTSAGFAVLVVSASPAAEPLDWADVDLAAVTVLRKPNVGYDFGSWAIGLDWLVPQVVRRARVLLVNDSLVGPFATLRPWLEQFCSSGADVWGLTQTAQFACHLQSYMMGFAPGVLCERPLRWFWQTVRHHDDKDLVIHRNEIGLGRLLAAEGYAVDAAFPVGTVVDWRDNPTIIGWRQLFDRGVPLVKRELVRNPDLAPDGSAVADEILRRFGAKVEQWV
ncbi:MAG: rhamnan synthesis F family protein [Micrococcales bacterium]|nr:rhamnan synthesis F family protein [Micrococcales bacterium]MCL2668622.1 rhamnan synthesis F family protein [Micrococcales bacterium]